MASTPHSSLAIHDGTIVGAGNATSFIQLANCDTRLSEVEITLNANEFLFALFDDASLKAERIRARGSTSHHIGLYGQRVVLELTNSLLYDVGIDVNTTDAGLPGSRVAIAASTIVYGTNSSLLQGCGGSSQFVNVTYENSIIAPLGPFDAVQGANCVFVNTLLSRQASSPPGTMVVDPSFVNAAGKDFHLTAGSPAIDAAVPSTLGLESTADLDGVVRPQGAAADIGAYEYTP